MKFRIPLTFSDIEIIKRKSKPFLKFASPKKRKLEYNVDQNTYDEFVKACSRKGYAPQVILEQAMRKFTQNGQI